MANIGKWNTPTAIATQISTALNSLGINSTASSASYDNSANLNIYADVEVNISSVSPAAGSYVSVYLLEAADGTNFPTPSDADLRLSPGHLLCVLPTGTTAGQPQRVVARNLVIPPAPFKLIVDNQTGAVWSSSGNTVKLLAYNVNLNG